jgi:ligand-binding sensor domain-containing protein/two-component sensor histidine kinase
MNQILKVVFYILVIINLLSINCDAQDFNFERISSKNGLPFNTVYGLDIDPDGYLWVATIKGLYRYDGYNFIASESASRNKQISINKNGQLYGQSELSFFKLNTKTKAITSIFNLKTSDSDPNNDQYNNIFIDKSDNVWASDFQYIKRYIPKENRLELYKILPEHGEFDFAKFREDTNGTIWAATTDGLYGFSPTEKKFIAIKRGIYIKSILIDGDKILLGLNEGRLLQYSIKNNDFEAPIQLQYKEIILNINHAWDRNYWVATKNRLFLYHSVENYFEEMVSLSKEGYTFTCIKKDQKNKIFWFGTNAGLIKLRYNDLGIFKKKIPDNLAEYPVKVNCFLEESQGNYWVGLSHSALLNYDKNKNTTKKITVESGVTVNDIAKSKNGETFCATNKGIFKVSQNKLKLYFATKSNLRNLLIDKKDRLWIMPRNEPIIVIDLNNKKALNLWDKTPYPNFFVNNTFNDITENDDGRIWFAAWFPKGFGICYFDEPNRKFVEVSDLNDDKQFVADYYLKIAKSPVSSNLAISAFGGSNTIDSKGKIIESIRSYSNGEIIDLPHFENIAIDASENNWLGSAEGLYLINKKNKVASRFTEFDGLSSNDITGGFLFTTGQTLLLGQTNEFTMIDVKKYIQKKTKTNLKLSNIKILGNTKIINYSKDLIFERNENSLSFDFSTLDYGNTSQSFYKYKFDHNTDWVDNGNSNNITFANLNQGKYDLQVKVGDNLGNWMEPKTLSFEIKPKFYETNWFKVILSAIILGILYAFYRFRLNQIQKVQLVRGRISTDLHDEVGSTMSAISIVGNLLKNQFEPNSKNNKLAERLVEDANSVSNTLDDIIWSIKPQNNTLIDFTSRINRYASDLFEAKNIAYEIQMPTQNQNISLTMDQRNNLYLIFKESINNLVKYANCTRATITMQVEKKSIFLEINDNGIGFDIHKTTQRNGIKNIRERTKKLHGEIDIISKIGEGTKIRVVIPI